MTVEIRGLENEEEDEEERYDQRQWIRGDEIRTIVDDAVAGRRSRS